MNKRERHAWLLRLWDYHNGTLSPDEAREVEEKIDKDPSARVDSERVVEVINELRQEGRWETHPEFPAQMVSRILAAEKHGAGKWVLITLVILGLIGLGWFLLHRKGELGEPEKTSQVEPHIQVSVPDQQPKPLEIRSSKPPILRRQVPSARSRLRLKDPVSGIEKNLDSSIGSPLVIPQERKH